MLCFFLKAYFVRSRFKCFVTPIFFRGERDVDWLTLYKYE